MLQGGPLMGPLVACGIGIPEAVPEVPDPSDLEQGCLEDNRALLASLREDPYGQELLEMTRQDAELGRMSKPVPGKVSLCSAGLILFVTAMCLLLQSNSVTCRRCGYTLDSPSSRACGRMAQRKSGQSTIFLGLMHPVGLRRGSWRV